MANAGTQGALSQPEGTLWEGAAVVSPGGRSRALLLAASSGTGWTLGAVPHVAAGHWVLSADWVTAGGYFSSLVHGVLSAVEKLKPLAEQCSSDLITPAWVPLSLVCP